MPIPSDLTNVELLQRRYKKAFEQEDLWYSHNRDIYDYFLPNRNVFDDKTPGQKKMDKIFDSTSLESIQQGASKLQEAIAPIWRRWAKIEPSDAVVRMLKQPDNDFGVTLEDIQKNLDDQSEIAFDYINRSNFATQFYEMCLDLLVGTATTRIEEEDSLEEPFTFHTMPPKGIAYEEGPKGTIETHWYNMKVAGRNLERTFKGITLSDDIKKKIEDAPESKIEMCVGVVYHPETREYYGLAWVKGEEELSWQVEYGETCPLITGRYSKCAGEVRGRGPAMQCYPDVRSLNKVKEFMLQKSAIDLAGMWTAVDDGTLNPYTISVAPGVVIPVGSNASANPSLSRLDTSSQLQLAEFQASELRNAIKTAFFADLREPSDAVVSATQFAMEMRELSKRIGSAFGRLQTEVLIPILKRVFHILEKKGIININLNGFETTVKFTSPLAAAQDQEDLMAIQQAFEFSLQTVGPDITKAAYNFEKFPAYAAKLTGMPQELVSSEAVLAQKMQAGAEMVRQQMSQNSNVVPIEQAQQ